VIADIHGTEKGLEASEFFLDKYDPDLMIVAGDITHFGPPDRAETFLDSFSIPLLAVNGNCDPPDVIDIIRSRNDMDLMDRETEIMGLKFVGLGYPSEVDFQELRMKGFDILVSHVPPKGCNDTVPLGTQIGDHHLRQLVLDTSPKLVISGHVHESRGVCELGESVCVNPGPARDGYGALVEITEKVDVQLLEH